MQRMPAADPGIRLATIADIPAIRSVLAAHGNDGPVVNVDIVGPYVMHLILNHRALVTEEAGAVIAFGAVVHAGVADHLADLFVMPDRLGQGIGRSLLAALFDDAARRVTFASDDPRAMPSYIRAGMSPLWISLYLTGDTGRLSRPGGLDVEAATPEALAGLEHAWTGHDRLDDHRYWASQPAADSFVITTCGEPVAFAHSRARQLSDIRVMDRMMIRPDADPIEPILSGLHRAGGGRAVDCVIPGPNPVLPVLLEHGFRITDHDQFMASAPDIVDPARRLPNPGLL